MRLPPPAALAILALSALLPGCAAKSPSVVTLADKQPLDVRPDQPANFIAPSDGSVGIFDFTQNRLLFETRLTRGQTITIDQPFQRVIIDTESVTRVAVPPADRLQIVFKESK